MKSEIIMVVALLAVMVAMTGVAAASIAGIAVKLDGGTTVTVSPGATIPSTIEVTTSSESSPYICNVIIGPSQTCLPYWRSVGWIINGASYCNNTPDHTTVGTFTETFSITAPTIPGTYSPEFTAYGSDDCQFVLHGTSEPFYLTNGVIVTTSPNNVPEFPTIILPVVAVIGLVFFFRQKKRKEE